MINIGNNTKQHFLEKEKSRTISSILAELSPNINIQEEAQKAMQILEKSILSLANAGWTIPCKLQPGDLIDLFNEINKKQLVQVNDFYDDFFLTYYTQDAYLEFYEITNTILANQHLKKWSRLLEECVNCFVKGQYLVTIPCLISIIEGIISTQIKDQNSVKNLDRKLFFKEQREKAFDQSITKLMWVSVETYTACLFRFAYFSDNCSATLNRHRILHGRDQTNWKKEDSLRLFHAIHTFQVIFSD